jgi:mono/diheme cytochrome c family protein
MVHGRIPAVLLAGSLFAACAAEQPPATVLPQSRLSDQAAFTHFIESNCIDCHNNRDQTAGLAIDDLIATEIGKNQPAWENIVRKLTTRQMPPSDIPRPPEKDYETVIAWLESTLDAAAAGHPNPGRAETFRRLNRTEYQNAIRDLLGLEVDVTTLLPPDESSLGFDNVTVTNLSATLLNRYLSAAQTISRSAVGRAPSTPREDTYRIRPDITQDSHLEGLPIGTRGGIVIPYYFPRDGEYEVRVRLMRDRNESIEGLHETHELDVLLDRTRCKLFTIEPPAKGESDQTLDANLNTRIKVTAGPHDVGVAFLAKSAALEESMRQPLNVHFNYYRHPRIGPAVFQVSIVGPIADGGPGDTPSRRRVFISTPDGETEEDESARKILTHLMRMAYRRPISEDDLKIPLKFYREGRATGDFEAGIETALSSILVNPQFLFHIERDPPNGAPGTVYPIDDVALASRLSFFLWSSIPDAELLDLAEKGALHRPEVLEQRVSRMLADKRSQSLITSFANQWLHLRNLDSVIPDMRLFPDFDDNLRQAMEQETELFFESILREDRSVLDLIKADYTFLNERLSKHYGIPHVYGSHFRRVMLNEDWQRGGLLRQGSILAVTSYATRTSPVLRGHWVLKNLLNAPPPPPPGNVPPLKDNSVLGTLTVRERLAQHRADEACARCHQVMDSMGFALENFDAVGRWRQTESDRPIDAAGSFLDGGEFIGVSGLEQALLKRPELFVRALAEKLMTYALGRQLEYYDAPAIRKIVVAARDDNYRLTRIIVGIVQSTPFQMRMSQ